VRRELVVVSRIAQPNNKLHVFTTEAQSHRENLRLIFFIRNASVLCVPVTPW
jgi:hypothetical protein